MTSTGRQASALALWGDGFVDDTTSQGRRVSRWDELSPDEYARFFPRLIDDDKGRSFVRQWVDHCIMARAWRLRFRHGRSLDPAVFSAISPADLGRQGRAAHAGFFPSVPAWRQWLDRRLPQVAACGDIAEEEAGLQVLLGIRRAITEESPEEPDQDFFAVFAFLTGVHPANIWPAAFSSHERDATAGWLGIVARGRRALMPADVADVLVDTIQLSRSGCASVREPVMARLIGTEETAVHLRRSAMRRLAGDEVIHAKFPVLAGFAVRAARRPVLETRIGSLAQP